MKTKRKPKLNVKLLTKVLKHIKAEPRRFDMSTFGTTVSEDVSPCGTQACIGGWAYFLTISPKSWVKAIDKAEDGIIDIHDKAQKALGLTNEEANSLFLTHTFDNSVALAAAKITLLKEDREKFVQEYPYR